MSKENKALFIDRMSGELHIAAGKDKYFKTKDATSKSGHSLVAQIEMTHSGIVTGNYGFYLPSNMRDGAPSFVQDYYKPVIVGHDENPFEPAEPIGRVVQSDYVDTSSRYTQKDSYLNSLYRFTDAKDKKADKVLDFVNYVITNYDSRSDYRGMGHIRGTFKITDEQAIAKILDERYLTVSTSMSSDSARCSVCGTEWVSQGPCDHSRGQMYEDRLMVMIPGKMFYDHVGVVNRPADKNAAGFKILGLDNAPVAAQDSITLYKYKDDYSIAANLFAWKDQKMFSLSDEKDVDLIEVKDNIQKMENAMSKTTETKTLRQKIEDAVRVSVCVYQQGETYDQSKEMSLSQYAQTLADVDLQKLITDIEQVMNDPSMQDATVEDAIKKFTDAAYKKPAAEPADATPAKTAPTKKKKKAKKMADHKVIDGDDIDEIKVADSVKSIKEDASLVELKLSDAQVDSIAEIAVRIGMEDPIATLVYGKTFDAKAVHTVLSAQDSQVELASLTEEQFVDMLNKAMPESNKYDPTKVKATDFCGAKGFFPVFDKDSYVASKSILATVKAADSVKGRILGAIEKKATKLNIDLADSFDSTEQPCNNNMSADEALQAFESAKAKLIELGIEVPVEQSNDSTKDSEIQILEAQLDAANEELDTLSAEITELKDSLKSELAIRLADLKILSGNFTVKDRVKTIEEHKERTVASLKDAVKDLSGQVDFTKFKINDGLAQMPKATEIVNPVLSQEEKPVSAIEKEKADQAKSKEKIYDAYRLRVARYGKSEADRWLDKVKKQSGLIPTLD